MSQEKNYAIVGAADPVKYPAGIWELKEDINQTMFYVKVGSYKITDSQTPREIYCCWFEINTDEGPKILNVQK